MAFPKKKSSIFDFGANLQKFNFEDDVFENLIKDITESKKSTEEIKKAVEEGVFNAFPTFIGEGVKITYTPLAATNATYNLAATNATYNNAPTWDTSVIDDLKKQVERLQAQQVKEAFIKKEPQKVQCEDILESKRSIKLSDE